MHGFYPSMHLHVKAYLDQCSTLCILVFKFSCLKTTFSYYTMYHVTNMYNTYCENDYSIGPKLLENTIYNSNSIK